MNDLLVLLLEFFNTKWIIWMVLHFYNEPTRFHLEKAKKNRKYTKRRRERLDEKI